jgi:hypothetical protein
MTFTALSAVSQPLVNALVLGVATLRLTDEETACNRRPEQTRNTMPGNPRNLITTAERRFPVRIRIAVPPEGLGQQ